MIIYWALSTCTAINLTYHLYLFTLEAPPCQKCVARWSAPYHQWGHKVVIKHFPITGFINVMIYSIYFKSLYWFHSKCHWGAVQPHLKDFTGGQFQARIQTGPMSPAARYTENPWRQTPSSIMSAIGLERKVFLVIFFGLAWHSGRPVFRIRKYV